MMRDWYGIPDWMPESVITVTLIAGAVIIAVAFLYRFVIRQSSPNETDRNETPSSWLCPSCGAYQSYQNVKCTQCGGFRPSDEDIGKQNSEP